MIKEGIIPVIAGTAVTTLGTMLKGVDMQKTESQRTKEDMMSAVTAGIIGFGIAHITLGALDLRKNRHRGILNRKNMFR